jgi:hypothetical protein
MVPKGVVGTSIGGLINLGSCREKLEMGLEHRRRGRPGVAKLLAGIFLEGPALIGMDLPRGWFLEAFFRSNISRPPLGGLGQMWIFGSEVKLKRIRNDDLPDAS